MARNDVEKIYSLSPMQEGMLFYSLVDKEGSAYFQQVTFQVMGKLEIDITQKSLDYIVARYDIFRTIFLHENIAMPKQVVLKNRNVKIFYEDYSKLDEVQQNQKIEEYKERDQEKAFNISRDVLLRLAILKLDDTNFTAVWSNHHILMDGWCVGVILREIFQVYDCIKNNRPIHLDKVYPYSDFIKWLEKRNKETAKQYWSKVVEKYYEIAGLPVLEPAKSSIYEKQEAICVFQKSTGDRLKTFAIQNHVTVFTVLQAVWGIILQRYNNCKDVIFGTIVSGRPPEMDHVEDILGLFINVVPVRVCCDETMSFVSLLKKMQDYSTQGEQYSYYPFYNIQQLSELKNNLIDHVLVYENFPSWKEQELAGFRISDFNLYEQTNYNFDIDIKNDQQLTVKINFNRNVYDEAYIQRILDNMEATVNQVLSNPAIMVDEIDIIGSQEKDLLESFIHGTKTDISHDTTILQMIEAQVNQVSEKTALLYGNESYTYQELNEKANRIARYLKRKGFGEGAIAGILLDRQPLMLECILAMWKIGGAYIPLDKAYPSNRISGILDDSQADLLLTDEDYEELVTENQKLVKINILNDQKEIEAEDSSNLLEVFDTRNLAYIIYTSGSTGKPKGAMVEQIGMYNHILAKMNELDIHSDCVIAQNASHCFDISVWQYMLALTIGGTTAIYNNELCMNVEKFVQKIEEDKVTILEVVPSYLTSMLDYMEMNAKRFHNLELMVVTGESLNASLAQKWFGLYPSIKLVNAYGPTEASDDITHYIMDKAPAGDTVSIGKPIQNMNIYIVDQWMNLCPVGVKGEICVAGIGVGKGYLNDPEKTEKVFISNIFGDQSERLYKTGDLGYWLPDGNIEFCGRKDYQVKIRGFRIELGEIESKLTSYEKVREAAVLDYAKEDGSKFLCGYVVAEDGTTTKEIKEYLESSLPGYMVPAYIVLLDKMPLTANGKIDRKELPAVDSSMLPETEYTAPTNEIEEILFQIWKEVLGIEHVGIHNEFFELGGDSIKAIQVSSRLLKYNMKVDIQDFFQYQTISKLSKVVTSINHVAEQGIVEGKVEFTPIQSWFFEQHFENMSQWNQAVLLKAKGIIREEIISQVWDKIVEHHDALRMIYKMEQNEFVQYNRGLEENIWQLEIFDFGKEPFSAEKITKECSRLQGKLDLLEGPLIQIGLFHTAEGDYLMVAAHHLIVDGLSWRIILEDFIMGYLQTEKEQDIVFQDKTTSFKEWSQLLNEYAQNADLKRYIQYWSEMEQYKVKAIPKDHQIEDRKTMDEAVYKVQLSKDETASLLTEVNKSYGTEIEDILLTALGIAVKNWTKGNQVMINLEGHGREEILEGVNLTRTVGWFTIEYPVVLNIENEQDLAFQIKKNKEALHAIGDNGIHYGILKYLAKREDMDQLMFEQEPEISFNYLGQLDEKVELDLFELSSISTGSSVSGEAKMNYALEINAAVTDKQFEVSFQYNALEYNKETIVRFAEEFESQLQRIIKHCTSKNKVEFTPSDFGSKDISLEEFESIEDLIKDL